jgi:spermidine/putrescine transport system substrate-binding protein
MVLGGAMVAGGGILAACGTSGSKSKGGGATPKDISATDKVLNWSNWPLYIDVDDKTKKHPTLDQFTAKTGIKVNYTEDINDNNEFFGKIRPQLAAGKSTGRDLIVMTD